MHRVRNPSCLLFQMLWNGCSLQMVSLSYQLSVFSTVRSFVCYCFPVHSIQILRWFILLSFLRANWNRWPPKHRIKTISSSFLQWVWVVCQWTVHNTVITAMCLQMLYMTYCCLHTVTSSVSSHNSSRKLASSLHPSPISLSLLFPNSTVSRHFGPFFKLSSHRTSSIAFLSIPRDRSRNGVSSKDEPLLPNSFQMAMNHFVRRFQLL